MAIHVLSQVLDSYNAHRKFIGFDAFSRFPKGTEDDPELDYAYFSDNNLDRLLSVIELQKRDSLINHVDRVSLVKGEVRKTIPNFLATCPHQLVKLSYIDFDFYQPTKIALKSFTPLVPK